MCMRAFGSFGDLGTVEYLSTSSAISADIQPREANLVPGVSENKAADLNSNLHALHLHGAGLHGCPLRCSSCFLNTSDNTEHLMEDCSAKGKVV